MSKLPPIANLMSPPEAKPLESFSITPSKSPSSSYSRHYTPEHKLAPMDPSKTPETKLRVLPSPPISPWMEKRLRGGYTQRAPAIHREAEDSNDPVLYPESEPFDSVNEQPLFPIESLASQAEALIDKHMNVHMMQYEGKIDRPTREEYRLALSCVPNIGSLYNRSPGSYMKRQRDEIETMYWQTKRICAKPGTKAKPVPIAPAPKQTKRAINRATPSKAPLPRVKRTPKSSPIAKLMGYPDKGRSATPDRQPGVKREDTDYSALPDYCPPTSTLPKNNPKILKADWPSSNVLNLSNDPDRDLLHEAELNLAGTLRLSCATYLCSKRRIFEARLNALRIGKEFRKTDAQQACKIDVNKASKLWTAYERVGWFDRNYFERFL